MADARDTMAAELALGLLEGEERAEALRRQLAEPDFAAEVAEWRDHFATLFPQVPEEAPPSSLEPKVMAAASGQEVERSPGIWRPAAIAAGLAVAVLSAALFLRDPAAPLPAPTAPVEQVRPMVASFTVEGFDQPKVAIYDSERNKMTMPGDMPIPTGHRAQLWASIEGGDPVALGNFQAVEGGVAASTMRELPAGTVLMITFEPENQPTSEPTGQLVAEGVLATI